MTTRTITRRRRRKVLATAGLGAMALTAFGIPAAAMADSGDNDSGEEKTDGLPAEITVEVDVSGDLDFPIATGVHILEPELVGSAALPDGLEVDDEGRLILTSAEDRTWETGGQTTVTIHLPDGDTRLVHIDGVGADDGEDPDEGDDGDGNDGAFLPDLYTSTEDTCSAGDLIIPLSSPADSVIFSGDIPADAATVSGDSLVFEGYSPDRMLGVSVPIEGRYKLGDDEGDLRLAMNAWCGEALTVSEPTEEDGSYLVDTAERWRDITTGEGRSAPMYLIVDALPSPEQGSLQAVLDDGTVVDFEAAGSSWTVWTAGTSKILFTPADGYEGDYQLSYTWGALKGDLGYPPTTVTFEVPPEPETPETPEEPEVVVPKPASKPTPKEGITKLPPPRVAQ